MAQNNQQSGYMGHDDKPVSTYNAHQDEFGFKEEDDPAWNKFGVGHGYGDQDHGNRTEETTGFGNMRNGGIHNGVGKTQFGLEGKTGSYGRQGPHPQLPDTTDTRSYGAVDPLKSDFDKAPHGIDAVPAGDGWGPEDTSRTHGARKDGLVNKIKKKLPGHHTTADGSVTHSDQKGIMEKIKDKLPGHHGSSDAADM